MVNEFCTTEKNEQEDRLISVLTGQDFGVAEDQLASLDMAKQFAHSYAHYIGGIAVLSDFQHNICYICSGRLGQNVLGISQYALDNNSAFEHAIFNKVIHEDLLERHILELRFFNFLKTIPASEKTHYYATCVIRLKRDGLPPLPILHSTRYILCHANGSVWLGLCTYSPLPQFEGQRGGYIVNTNTGLAIDVDKYKQVDCNLLSKRQLEILSLLAKGECSKQIADKLCISVHTVNRHRQDILSKLNVSNSAAAVEIGFRMQLI